MGSEGVFPCNVCKSIDLLIFDAMQKVRLRNKGPHSSTIFKEISKVPTTNFPEEDTENRIEDLIHENKLVNNKIAAGLDSFFVTSFIKKHSQNLTQNLFLSQNKHQKWVRFQYK